jgi:hypothetical protein
VQVDAFNRANSTNPNRGERADIVNISTLKFLQPVDVIFRIK